MVSVGNVWDAEGLASILGCRVALFPMKYLSLPLGAPYKDSTIWNGFMKMAQRLAGIGRGFIYQREAS